MDRRLPLILQALLVGLAALLSGAGQAHSATVVLADAALAAIVAVVVLGISSARGPDYRCSPRVSSLRGSPLACSSRIAALAIGGRAIEIRVARPRVASRRLSRMRQSQERWQPSVKVSKPGTVWPAKTNRSSFRPPGLSGEGTLRRYAAEDVPDHH